MERIKLDIVPKGIIPVCHVSQYDTGRVIRLDLMDGLQGYSLTTETVVLNVKKPDNNIVTAEVTVTSGKTYVDIVTTQQMCAVAGDNLCELQITKGTQVIGSLNFIMRVEADPLAEGIESESVIHDLKTTIDDMIEDSLSILAPEEEEKGAIDTFESDVITPIIDCKVDINAVQSGTGDASPTNKRPIQGWTGCRVTRTGKNIMPVCYQSKSHNGITWTLLSDGTIHAQGTATARSFFHIYDVMDNVIFKSGTYTNSFNISGEGAEYLKWLMGAYYKSGEYAGNISFPNRPTFTLTQDDANNLIFTMYVEIPTTYVGNYIDVIIEPQCEIGSIATEFEAYQGETILVDWGINQWDEQWELGTFASGNLVSSTTRIRNKNPIPVLPNTTYYLNCPTQIYVMDIDKDTGWTQYQTRSVNSNSAFTTNAWAKYIYISPVDAYGTTYNNDISINYPLTDKKYHAYISDETKNAGIVGAGIIDLTTGEMIVTHRIAIFDGSDDEPWIKSSSYSGGYYYSDWAFYNSIPSSIDHKQNIGTTVTSISDYSSGTNVCYFDRSLNFKVDSSEYPTLADFRTFLSNNNLQVLYPLKNIQTYNLNPTEILTLLGINNIFADTGDIDVIYQHALSARYIYFNNTDTDLTATNVEAAIKELLGRISGT